MPTIDRDRALADIDRVIGHKSDISGSVAAGESVTLSIACIERWTPPNSPYRRPYKPMIGKQGRGAEESHFQGSLRALRADVAADALTSFAELVHAALFSDLLGQAEHLCDEHYLLASTVLAGATLEQHLRVLADRNSLDLLTQSGKPKKAANINDQLAKQNAYSNADRDLVSAWLRLRNEAAHNDPAFQKRTEAEIRQMITGTRNFIARFPA